MLSLDSSSSDTSDEVLLQGEEQRECRDQREHRHGKHRPPRRHTRGVQKQPESHRDGIPVRTGEIEQLVEEVIPRPEKREKQRSNEGGYGKGQDNPRIDTEFAAPVDQGRLIDVARKTPDELHQQEDEKSIRCKELGNDDRQEGVDPPEIAEHDVPGDGGDMGRQHEGDHHHRKPEFLSYELQPCKRIGGQRAEYCIGEGAEQTDDEGILEECIESDDADALPSFTVILCGEHLRPNACIGENHITWLEGCTNKPQDGIEHSQTEGDDECVEQKPACQCFLCLHTLLPASIGDQIARNLERQGGKAGDDDQQDPCHGCCNDRQAHPPWSPACFRGAELPDGACIDAQDRIRAVERR